MELERLDRILAGSGMYTRSQARDLIRSGAVLVDGTPVRRPEEKIGRDRTVTAAGEAVDTARYVYYMMNKPRDTICATEDGAYPAVTGLLPRALRARGLFPVGRLDADATGLLLLTDDGAFAHRVTAPRSDIPKTYRVLADRPVGKEWAAILAAGMVLEDGTAYRPARLTPEEECQCLVTVTEGKFHEVKNLIAACGGKVLCLERVSVGGLALDKMLMPGAVKRLSEEEVSLVFRDFL